MDAREFAEVVQLRLGHGLSRATYANVQALAAELQARDDRREDDRYVLPDESDRTPDQAVTRFLTKHLVDTSEAARQRLWLAYLQLCYAVREADDRERFGPLFEGLE